MLQIIYRYFLITPKSRLEICTKCRTRVNDPKYLGEKAEEKKTMYLVFYRRNYYINGGLFI